MPRAVRYSALPEESDADEGVDDTDASDASESTVGSASADSRAASADSRATNQQHAITFVSRALVVFDSRTTSGSGPGEDSPRPRLDTSGEDYYMRCHRLPPSPPWAWNEAVAEVARRFGEEAEQMPVPLGVTAGPAVVLAMAAVALQVCCFLAFMPFTMLICECSEDGYAQVPRWWWLAFLPLSAICCALEVLALRYVLVPKIQVLKYFRCLFPFCWVHLKAEVWLLQVMSLSVMHTFHMANIGNFTAMLYRATSCSGSQRMNEIWRNVLQQSPLFSWADAVDLRMIGLCFWCMKFFQAFYAILNSFPCLSQLEADPPYYGVCRDRDRFYVTEYATLCESRMNHGIAVFLLAEACGMASIVDTGLMYAQTKADLQWNRQEPFYQRKCLDHAHAQILRAIQITVLAGFLKNTAQLNLQVSVLTVRRAVGLMGGVVVEGERMALISLGIAFMGIASSVADAVKALLFAREILAKVDGLGPADFKDKSGNQDDGFRQEVLARATKLRRKSHILLLCTGISCFFAFYALQKLALSFWCPSAVGNINGCVDLTSLGRGGGRPTTSSTSAAPGAAR